MTEQPRGSTSQGPGEGALWGGARAVPTPTFAGLSGALRAGLGSWVLVPAVAVMFGMQTLRVLLPLLVYVLRDRVGLQAMHLGGIALALFALSFFVGPLLRTVGERRLAFVTLAGLAVVRVAVQLWQGDPLVDLALAMVGTLLFLLYLPTAAVSGMAAATSTTTAPVAMPTVATPGSSATSTTPESGDAPSSSTASWSVAPGGPASAAPFALGFLLGLGSDAALNGILGTYDLAWRTGAAPSAAVAALAVVLVALAAPSARRGTAGLDAATFTVPRAWPWLALGPLLALEMLVFQNVARLATLAGVSLPAAAALAAAGHAVGLVVAAFALRGGAARAAARVTLPAAAAGSVLLVLSVLPAGPKGVSAALLFLAGQAALDLLAVPVLTAVGARDGAMGGTSGGGTVGYGRLALAHGGGMVLLVLFLFLAYSGYDIALPFSADVLPPVAALVVGACALRVAVGAGRSSASGPSGASVEGGVAPPRGGATRARAAAPRPARALRLGPAALMILVTAIPLAQFAMQETPEAVPGAGGPVRVMTFNLHNGFATDGRLDLEALARVIEEQEPDVLALQEVSRGWVINGTVDMFGWLSRRLGMAGVYGPTAGPLWGNALLSRFPLGGHEFVSLPTEDLLLRRGLIDAAVDVGNGTPLRVIVTHYHHPEDGGPVRVLESAALVDRWDGSPRTVVMGDLNAMPDDREIEALREAGLVEVLAAAGVSPGYTYSSDEPFQRIDYIWVTPDLLAAVAGAPVDVRLTTGTASDHLGIAATVGVVE